MTPRRILLPMVLFLVALGGACTGDGDDGPVRTPSRSSAEPASPVPTGPVRFEPGAYRYEFGGVTADLRFDGSAATMDVKNVSGAQLAKPSLYVIDRTGARQGGVVAEAVPIPDGNSVTFQVAFPDTVTGETIGLVILLFGGSNYGAFAPVPAA